MKRKEKLLKINTKEKEKLLRVIKAINEPYSFNETFDNIISDKFDDKEQLKEWLSCIIQSGRTIGIVPELRENWKFREIYTYHIDSFEESGYEIEELINFSNDKGDRIPTYTRIVWVCFERYCKNIYQTIFEEF